MGIADYTNKLGFLLRIIPHQTMVGNLKGMAILPFYHIVGDHDMPHIKHLYQAKSIAQFISDLDYYAQYFNFVEVDQLQRKGNNKPNLHLSFDDGLVECYSIIRPILLRKGIPASFFINTAFIDNSDLMHRCKASFIYEFLLQNPQVNGEIETENTKYLIRGDETTKQLLFQVNFADRERLDFIINELQIPFKDWLNSYQPYMNEEQIRTLAKDGFNIGAHSHNHPVFKDINRKDQIHQIKTSVEIVNQICQSTACSFSFPFHDINVDPLTWDYIKKTPQINYTFGVSGIKSVENSNHFHRIAMEDCSLTAKNRIKSAYLAQQIRKVIRKG